MNSLTQTLVGLSVGFCVSCETVYAGIRSCLCIWSILCFCPPFVYHTHTHKIMYTRPKP